MIDAIKISKLSLSKYKLINSNQEIVSICFLNEYEVSKKNYAYRLNKIPLQYKKISNEDDMQTGSILILPN